MKRVRARMTRGARANAAATTVSVDLVLRIARVTPIAVAWGGAASTAPARTAARSAAARTPVKRVRAQKTRIVRIRSAAAWMASVKIVARD